MVLCAVLCGSMSTEESMESLKVLHYFLDDCKVACVLITNNALDAAKMNRAIVVYRQSPELEELVMLLAGSMGFKSGVQDPVVKALSRAYHQLMARKDPLVAGGMIFNHRFGLRDFYSACAAPCMAHTLFALSPPLRPQTHSATLVIMACNVFVSCVSLADFGRYFLRLGKPIPPRVQDVLLAIERNFSGVRGVKCTSIRPVPASGVASAQCGKGLGVHRVHPCLFASSGVFAGVRGHRGRVCQ
jgi:hypothetical protein